MANNVPGPRSIAIQHAVEQDTQLAEEARLLAHKAISIAHRYLDSGSPKMQLDVIKAIMPAIGRGMVDKGESDVVTELREQIQLMMRAMSGETDVA